MKENALSQRDMRDLKSSDLHVCIFPSVNISKDEVTAYISLVTTPLLLYTVCVELS